MKINIAGEEGTRPGVTEVTRKSRPTGRGHTHMRREGLGRSRDHAHPGEPSKIIIFNKDSKYWGIEGPGAWSKAAHTGHAHPGGRAPGRGAGGEQRPRPQSRMAENLSVNNERKYSGRERGGGAREERNMETTPTNRNHTHKGRGHAHCRELAKISSLIMRVNISREEGSRPGSLA